MIIHNVKFNWYDLSDALAGTNNLVLEDVNKTVELRIEIFNKQNSSGGVSTDALASPRLFTFSGTIFWDRAGSQNWQELLSNMLRLWDGKKELSWEDDGGNKYKTQAKLYSMPRYTTNIDNDIVWFTFELLSDNAEYISFESKITTGGLGVLGGTTLWVTLWTTLSWIIDDFTVNNLGDFRALTRVEIQWELVNPKLQNLTNGKFYQLSRTTTDLIYDNTSDPVTVTDMWINVRGDRVSGSTGIVLEPGENNLILISDNYSVENDITVKITYNDTFLKS